MDFTRLDIEHKEALLLLLMCLNKALEQLSDSTGVDSDLIYSNIWLEVAPKVRNFSDAQIEELITKLETQSGFSQPLSTPVVVIEQIFDSEESQDYGN